MTKHKEEISFSANLYATLCNSSNTSEKQVTKNIDLFTKALFVLKVPYMRETARKTTFSGPCAKTSNCLIVFSSSIYIVYHVG